MTVDLVGMDQCAWSHFILGGLKVGMKSNLTNCLFICNIVVLF